MKIFQDTLSILGASVSIVSEYRLDDWDFILAEAKDFSSCLCDHSSWGPPSQLLNEYRGPFQR
jgi:hypothetical protein